ncbi:AfsR/SARP family transcriptional regulator [Protofrankia symbiont of Coriaria ruscifolia]|uniref:AfsR/SARP family transcriptional regulator n=1 Tax=Protofrankia symbiont of Coriaria ruscifolia TaxID=1306542 RepID=UPI0013EF5E40|nr:winged helix-turn-helix domain-containing protein [Protofrankia symbiont of Coriaria ruscifolia]
MRTVLILSKSASLEHKSDATRLRRSPGVLGALEVRDDDDREIDIPGSRRRALLVRLALDAGRPVGGASLVVAVWADADQQPAEEANALQTLVSRLRRSLGDGTLVVRSGEGHAAQAAGPRWHGAYTPLARAVPTPLRTAAGCGYRSGDGR